MKYMVVHLIKGEAEVLQQKLLYGVAEKFDVSEAIKRKPPAHITLKYSFQTEDIRDVELVLEQFVKTHKQSTYQVKGFNHFDDHAIFIDIQPSEDIKTTYASLIEALKNISWMTFKQFDGSTHFHSTVAHTDIKEKFSEIWTYVNTFKADFEAIFDNLALIKLVDGVWEIHKEFRFS